MSDYYAIEPANSSWTAGSCTVFLTDFTDLLSYFIKQFCRERTVAYSRCVSFTNSNHMADFCRTNTRSDRNASSYWIGRSDEWVCSLVNIEHNTLSTFKQNSSSLIERIV